MTVRSIVTRLNLVAFGTAMLIAAPLRAQENSGVTAASSAPSDSIAPVTRPSNATVSESAGPTLSSATVGAHRLSAETSPAPFAPRGGYGQSTALMVVGGAAVLVGLVVGGGAGYAISVGGAVIGLLGLYQYLQ